MANSNFGTTKINTTYERLQDARPQSSTIDTAVEATRIGEFTKSGRCIVRYNQKEVMNLGMDFLHEGRPIEVQKSRRPAKAGVGIPTSPTGRRGASPTSAPKSPSPERR